MRTFVVISATCGLFWAAACSSSSSSTPTPGADGGGGDGGHACTVVADCPLNPGASCAKTCPDGSNPCTNACVNNQCVARGCL